MKPNLFKALSGAIFAFAILLPTPSVAEPQHGIAMYGAPALGADFTSLPYANPDAPKGGRIVSGEVGSFDSLNPHIQKGRVPWQLRFLAYESLMGRSYDEPFSLYGVIAESIEVGEDGKWVEFTLRPEARFSDGTQITPEDVIWSYETLGTEGHGRYRGSWEKIESIAKTGFDKVRITFKERDRELALIMGMRPILKKAQWDGKSFADSALEVPISSAPYVIDSYDAGRFVSLKRNPDYWGEDIPFRKGTNNFDEVRMEFFGDGTAMFEAFKSGELSTLRESNAAKWAQQYSFPRVENGDVIKAEIPHERPTGITGFVMNTRRDIFKDWRVREAMMLAFNYEFINNTLNGGTEPRITSYFSNSVLGLQEGPATGKVLELLTAHQDTLLPGAIEGYALPVSDGTVRNRAGIREATRLLEEAGWSVIDGVLTGADGKPFVFEILERNGSAEVKAIQNIYVEALERLGIFATITAIDSAQYRERTDQFDFDMTYYTRGLSLSPGNEQLAYWGMDAADTAGSRNWMGVQNPAIDAMVEVMLTSDSQEDYRAAVRALDRILVSGRYVIPIWYSKFSRLAHAKELRYSENLPAYGDWIGFLPDVWWYEE